MGCKVKTSQWDARLRTGQWGCEVERKKRGNRPGLRSLFTQTTNFYKVYQTCQELGRSPMQLFLPFPPDASDGEPVELSARAPNVSPTFRARKKEKHNTTQPVGGRQRKSWHASLKARQFCASVESSCVYHGPNLTDQSRCTSV